MDPLGYIVPYLEQRYAQDHPGLTPAARELARADIAKNPDKYATDEHSLALVAYMRTRAYLLQQLDRMEELSDEEFELQRNRLFDEARLALFKIVETDRLCVDAQLLAVLLADTSLDDCLSDLMKLEVRIFDHLKANVEGFDPQAEHFWATRMLGDGVTAASLTVSEPAMVGWLHTLEAISQLSLSSARYKAAIHYAQLVMRAEGYPNKAAGTMLLALARLEDEDAFFKLVAEQEDLEDSPWYLFARTLLLFKTGKMKPARRALRDFVTRCDGAAFFLLNPTYLTPYLPDRPEPRTSYDLAHQVLWEADGIIVDTPDFVPWAEGVPGITDISESFADRNGF